MILSLKAAFAKACVDAPEISKEEFLEQTRQHLLDGMIKASAFACIIEQSWEPESFGQLSYAPRSAADLTRKEIPAIEWADLDLDFSDEDSGRACVWGHERSPKWTRDERGEEKWGEILDGAPVYTELLLIAESFDKLWRRPARESATKPMSDAELRAFIRARESKPGKRPPIRTWKECPELRERGVTKQRFETTWRGLYPTPERGRPRGE